MSAAERRGNAIFDQDSNPLSPCSAQKSFKKNIKNDKKSMVRLEPPKSGTKASIMPLDQHVIHIN